MKIIISSSLLHNELKILINQEITDFRIVGDCIRFYGLIKGSVFCYGEQIDCHILDSGKGVFDAPQWRKLYEFLKLIPEQPLTIEFDEKIRIDHCVANF